MDIGRRELLTGSAAMAAAALVPFGPTSAVPATLAALFRFAVPRRMLGWGYLFCDPWRVDFANGAPDQIIHEASGAVFPTDRFGDLDDDPPYVVIRGIWRDYAPSYPLTALRFDEHTRAWTLYDLPAPAINKAMETGDIDDLGEMCFAARGVAAWCRRQTPPKNANGAILARPTTSIYDLRYEESQV
jgi:hypothetical protein